MSVSEKRALVLVRASGAGTIGRVKIPDSQYAIAVVAVAVVVACYICCRGVKPKKVPS